MGHRADTIVMLLVTPLNPEHWHAVLWNSLSILWRHTHQAGWLQARGGSVNSSHSWYSLIVVDEPLCSDQQLRCVWYQVLLPGDQVNRLHRKYQEINQTLNSFKTSLTQGRTGFAQILFQASEDQGTFWAMTKFLLMASQLWQRKPKETC